jgi:hypothetical protein
MAPIAIASCEQHHNCPDNAEPIIEKHIVLA